MRRPVIIAAAVLLAPLAACDDTTKPPAPGETPKPPSPEPGPPQPDDSPADGGAEQPSSEPVPPSPDPAPQPAEPPAPSPATFDHAPAGAIPAGQGPGYLDRTVWSPNMCWPLAEAGFPNGFETTLSFDLGGATVGEPMAVLIQESLAAIGIKTTINKVPGATWRAALLKKDMPLLDRAVTALVTDLHERGLEKDVSVIVWGEFGRTPYAQNGDGRDHNNKGFTMWMAGGGVKGGMNYGMTDDYGYEAVLNKMHIHDWHATVLALMGLDHERLTYRYAGRDYKLTDLAGNVVKDIIA